MTYFSDLLPGIIWACFMGLAIGNFATNPIYRLPRRESLFARDPYCGDCNALLRPKDLFPVFSWLSTMGKCRYCGAGIPAAYAVTEAVIGLFFVLCYLKFGFNEQFILVAFGGTAFVMLAMMLLLDNFFSDRTLVACMVFGMLHRVLHDGNIYDFAGTAYAGLIAGALAWKISGKQMARDMAAFPPYLKLLTLAGVWLHLPQLIVLLVITVMVKLLQVASCKLQKGLLATLSKWLVEWTIIASIILLICF